MCAAHVANVYVSLQYVRQAEERSVPQPEDTAEAASKDTSIRGESVRGHRRVENGGLRMEGIPSDAAPLRAGDLRLPLKKTVRRRGRGEEARWREAVSLGVAARAPAALR